MLSIKTAIPVLVLALSCIQASAFDIHNPFVPRGVCSVGKSFCKYPGSKTYFKCRFGKYKKYSCGARRVCVEKFGGRASCVRR
ncbi:hypothetical protein AYI69_g4027 [Smittium culicis]|uniref:Uncharacterized protein n=1 Tax=Smittium culicis TaxID=133412 RepID=A0A1R1YHL0_9FUNG|nr:hypothetical protein AYI69_g4027 [Smittium culicis]